MALNRGYDEAYVVHYLSVRHQESSGRGGLQPLGSGKEARYIDPGRGARMNRCYPKVIQRKGGATNRGHTEVLHLGDTMK